MHFSISNLLLCKVEKGRISGSCQAFQLQMFVLQLIGTWSAHCCGRQAAKSAPELAAGSRSSAPPNSLSGGSRWQQARERAVLSWTTRQGSRREFLLQSSVLPPAQLSLVSILHGKSPTCMLHAHACHRNTQREENKKSLGYQVLWKPCPLNSVSAVLSQTKKWRALWQSLRCMHLSPTFTSILSCQPALSSPRP